MGSIADEILEEIAGHEAGWCFSPKDFLRFGSRDALDKAFSRLTAAGRIRRIGRGLYDLPRYSELLGETLSPDANQMARALARKFGWRIWPGPAKLAQEIC